MSNADRFLMVDTVRARRRIQDSPLAGMDSGAPRGSLGTVVDIDQCAGLVFVDFGRGAIACDPTELVVTSERPTWRGSFAA